MHLNPDGYDYPNSAYQRACYTIRVLRAELTNVLEWAEAERAPLRDAEIGSIRKILGLAAASPTDRPGPVPGNPSNPSAEEQLSRLREKIGDVEKLARLFVDAWGGGTIAHADMAAATALRNHLLGEGGEEVRASVAGVDVTPPSGASAETEGH